MEGYKGNLLMDALVRDAVKTMQQDKQYECDLCKDSHYLTRLTDGRLVASIDIEALKDGISMKVCTCKAKKDAEESLKRTGLELCEYRQKTLETFREDTEIALQMKRLAKEFLKDSKATGIGYFGKSGTGKTHICIAICNELINKGISHKYFNYRRDIQALNALRYSAEEYNRKIGEFVATPVLYIDDLFKLATTNKGTVDVKELQIMFDIINTRYINNKKIIISSEYTVAEIKELDEAIGSRIYEMVSPYGLKCEGKNRRF